MSMSKKKLIDILHKDIVTENPHRFYKRL